MPRLCIALILVATLPAFAGAQEGAGALTPPRVTEPPSAQAPEGEVSQTQPSQDATPEPTPAAEGDLSDVPPPPPAGQAGYQTPRYAAPTSGVASDAPDLRIPSRVATRLRTLDGSLATLAARGGSVVDGVVSMVSGGLAVGLGIYVHSDDRLLASYLYLWGAAGLARGVIDVALRPRASEPHIQFAHMPMGTMSEVEARLQFGENALQRLAERGRLSRILDASISVATGALVLPIYFIPKGFVFDEAFDYFVLVGAGISVITGIVNLATRTGAERRWAAYQELRGRLEGPTEQADTNEGFRFAGLGGGPVEGGAAFTANAVF